MRSDDHFGSFIKPPIFYEKSGAMHIRGRFILPVAGASIEATEKTKRHIAITSSVMIVLILVASIFLSYNESHGLPLQNELLESVGKPIEEVAAQLDVPMDQMLQVEPGLYRISAGGEYKGITFDILLYFEENEGLLRNYGYEARYEADTGKAAKDIAAITKNLAVKEIELANGTALETSKKQLKRHFADVGSFTANVTLENNVAWSAALTEYIEHLEAADYYEGRSGEYLIKDAIYYEDLHIAYELGREEVTVKLWCTIETDRTKDY